MLQMGLQIMAIVCDQVIKNTTALNYAKNKWTIYDSRQRNPAPS